MPSATDLKRSAEFYERQAEYCDVMRNPAGAKARRELAAECRFKIEQGQYDDSDDETSCEYDYRRAG